MEAEAEGGGRRQKEAVSGRLRWNVVERGRRCKEGEMRWNDVKKGRRWNMVE